MGFTVAVKVEHLVLPKILLSTPSEQSGILLVPNVEPYGTVKATVKDFVQRNLFIPDNLQVLQAPLFRKLSEKENVEDIYKRYACQAEIENPELHFDEDNFVFFAREGGRSIDLDDNRRLEEYHIVEKTVLQLRRLPQCLSEDGGRIFVETKDGILPLLGVNHATQVVELKHALERMTGIPVDQQLLSSVGRSMHDGLCIKDFDGPHRVCEDSTLDLCKSGDTNVDQAHLRMVISVNVMGEQSFTMVVQGRDLVQSVQQVVESRTGVATWQQRITYNGIHPMLLAGASGCLLHEFALKLGKILQERKTLSEYYIHPECALQVTIFRSPCKPPPKTANNFLHSRENSGMEEQKPAARKIKLVRTSKGHINGTITIPVLTTDTISDLKRKVRRTLQPLTERNFVVLRSPAGSGNNSTNSTPSKVSPSPSSNGDQFSTSGRKLSRVLSFTGRTFSGPLGNSSNNLTPTTKMAGAAQFNGDTHTPSSVPPVDINGNNHQKVARVLSFKNYSGPLVSPGMQTLHPAPAPQPIAAPLYPPPLSSPSGSPPNLNDQPAIAVPEIRTTPVKSADDLPHLPSGTPLKFVPMRPNSVPITPKSSTSNIPITPKSSGLHHPLTRAQSMGRLSFTPTQLHSLPVHPLPGFQENILPHTAPIPLGSNSTSPKSGRGKETAEKKGLGAWLTGSMHVLKEHIKSPFTRDDSMLS